MTAAIEISKILNNGGLTLVGCGKMGGALLEGWLQAGVDPGQIRVVEPNPTSDLAALAMRHGFRLSGDVEDFPTKPAVLVIAVKPQMMAAVLPAAASIMGPDTLLLSIAAGVTIESFEASTPERSSIIRAMPNTPAAIGQGVSAIIGNSAVGAAELDAAEALLNVVGAVVRLDSEEQIDAVTAVSGSGPAYVFHMIEAIAAAAIAEGLPEPLALRLAESTVSGAGALAAAAEKDAATLRVDVTSPNGVTAAALEQLMNEQSGLTQLMTRSIAAGAARSRELRG